MPTELKSGDLCEIVDHPDWKGGYNRDKIGMVVILTRLCESDLPDPWQPRWKVIEMPQCQISAKILRKIPPPQIDEEELEDLGLVV